MTVDRTDSWGEQIGREVESYLRRYGAEGLSLMAIATTAAGSIPRIWGGPLLWILIGIILGGFAVWLRNKNRDSVVKLRTQLTEAQALVESSTSALRTAVEPLANNLNEYLDLSGADQRLSVYLHCGAEFRLVARVAQDPSLRSVGRERYPENQGMIGTVWQQGDAYERVGRAESWDDWVSRFGFSPEEASRLRMKSKCIAAVRLDHNREPVGIVLIESQRPRGIKAEQFENLQNSYITRSLSELLHIAGPFILRRL